MTLDECAHYLNALPFVRWDRCTRAGGWVWAYGWIDREDGRADFVMLEFAPDAAPWHLTSSAAYSREIDRILRGTDEGHVDCERIADVFGDRVPHTTSQNRNGAA